MVSSSKSHTSSASKPNGDEPSASSPKRTKTTAGSGSGSDSSDSSGKSGSKKSSSSSSSSKDSGNGGDEKIVQSESNSGSDGEEEENKNGCWFECDSEEGCRLRNVMNSASARMACFPCAAAFQADKQVIAAAKNPDQRGKKKTRRRTAKEVADLKANKQY